MKSLKMWILSEYGTKEESEFMLSDIKYKEDVVVWDLAQDIKRDKKGFPKGYNKAKEYLTNHDACEGAFKALKMAHTKWLEYKKAIAKEKEGAH